MDRAARIQGLHGVFQQIGEGAGHRLAITDHPGVAAIAVGAEGDALGAAQGLDGLGQLGHQLGLAGLGGGGGLLGHGQTTGGQADERARAFLAAAATRLQGFACPAGGFSLFGRDPGDPILTAYGLRATVTHVQGSYPALMAERLHATVGKIRLVLVLFGGALLVISLILLGNTIRLAIFSKRYLINTMKLVGATKWFIMRPFLASSVWQGLAAGAQSLLEMRRLEDGTALLSPGILDISALDRVSSTSSAAGYPVG